MADVGSPGPNHTVEVVGDAYHVRPTPAFMNREKPPWWMALVILGLMAVPVVWMALKEQPVWSQVVLWGLLVCGGLYAVSEMIPNVGPYEPVVVRRDGRVEYEGKLIQPGPVELVRVYRHNVPEVLDTHHIELVGPAGTARLPAPGYAGEGSEDDLLPLAGWLADLFGVPRPTEVEVRQG